MLEVIPYQQFDRDGLTYEVFTFRMFVTNSLFRVSFVSHPGDPYGPNQVPTVESGITVEVPGLGADGLGVHPWVAASTSHNTETIAKAIGLALYHAPRLRIANL